MSSDENENDPEFQKNRNKRRTWVFKKKIELAEVKEQLAKVNLLIKLRLCTGPLFIYMLLESIVLSK